MRTAAMPPRPQISALDSSRTASLRCAAPSTRATAGAPTMASAPVNMPGAISTGMTMP